MKRICIFLFLLTAINVFSAESYSINFTDVRFNHSKRKFYFLRWDMLRENEENRLERYVRGDFEGRILKRVTKFFRGRVQSILVLNDYGACILRKEYSHGEIRYELHYNSEGFIPYADPKKNLIKRILYKNGRPAAVSVYDGHGRRMSSE